MADKKAPTKKFITPAGIVGKFPKLIEPDEYNGKKKYKVSLILPTETAQVIIQEINKALPEAEKLKDAAVAAGLKKGKKLKDQDQIDTYNFMIDPETGTETGMVQFNFASNYSYEDKEGKTIIRQILHFGAKGGAAIPMADRPVIWGGSKIKVSYSLFPFHNAGANNYGVSLRLEAVQVIELRTGGGGDASSFGFGEEEGYEAETTSSTHEASSEGPSETADDGDF